MLVGCLFRWFCGSLLGVGLIGCLVCHLVGCSCDWSVELGWLVSVGLVDTLFVFKV
jgi:FtsH-binding integral membrane protein